jgi:PKD repeat protein
LQYKNRKNLYKIVFITILLGFIISLAGCNWLSLGLLNIFDPQAQIRVNYTGMDTEAGTIALEVYSLNEVEFIGTGFEYDYYDGTTKISQLSKTVGATFYVAPSDTPGTHGPITTINLPLYYQEVQDYMTSNPLVVEMTCTINMIGTDGAGHSISKSVTVDLPALQPGIDFIPPEAAFSVVPGTTGTVPFTVTFDASGSTDAESGIASYNWDFGDGSSATGVMPAAHTYTATGTYIVRLTVLDYFGNAGIYTETITVTSIPSTITLEANPSTVIAAGDTSIITATVKDASGSVVTDGAAVTFSTSLGTLSASSVSTINGIATTILTTVSGSATVTAICAPATNTVVVTCP